MDKSSNVYVLKFALVICVVASAGLALTYNVLRPLQLENQEFDQKRNVLQALALYDPNDPAMTRAKIEQLYAERIEEKVVEGSGGAAPEVAPERVEVTNLTPAELKEIRDPLELRRKRPVFLARDAEGALSGICIPIEAKGLWSTLYGYLALGPDAAVVRGITFYKHGETPGLGGEVDNPNWKRQWTQGRSILADGKLVGVQVKKGKVDPSIAYEAGHMVDGLSGATITSKGVSVGLQRSLEWFRPFLQTYWKSN